MKKMKITYFNIFAICLMVMAVFSSCKDENETVAGNGMEITGFTPEQGYSSNEITITGKNFGTEENRAEVYFNETVATEFISYSDTEIKVRVPVGASTGRISVLKDGNYAFSEKDFTYLEGATLESISTNSSYIGDEITITGKNFFDVEPANVKVYFGDAVTTATSVSETEIKVNVPQDVNAGEVNISVEFVGYQTLTGLVFNVIANPQITGIAPVSGLAGNDVTITGQNFYGADEELSNIHVFFGEYEAVVKSVNSTQIKVQAPVSDSYISDGYIDIKKVTIKYDGREDLILGDGTTAIYKILLPKLTSVSPLSLGIGDELTITGENFYEPSKDNLNIHVFVADNEIDQKIITASTSEIKFNVPEDIATGENIEVYVRFDTPISGKSYTTDKQQINIKASAWSKYLFINDCYMFTTSSGGLNINEYSVANESNNNSYRIWNVTSVDGLNTQPEGYDPSNAKTFAIWDFKVGEYIVFKLDISSQENYWLEFEGTSPNQVNVSVSCGTDGSNFGSNLDTVSIFSVTGSNGYKTYNSKVLSLGILQSGLNYVKVEFSNAGGGCIRNLKITNTEPDSAE